MTKENNKSSSDLLAILSWTIVSFLFIIIPALKDTAIRSILGIPMILFIPGYVLIAALFPKKEDLEVTERIAYSFGVSIVMVPLIGLLLNFTFGMGLYPIFFSLSIYIIVLSCITIYRRRNLFEAERFDVSVKRIYKNLVIENIPKNRMDYILTGIFLFMTIIGAGTLIYVIITPITIEKYTEFYILNNTGKAENYPINLYENNSTNLLVGVSNHEYSFVNYTIQIELDKKILKSEQLRLKNNELWEENMTFVPDKKGKDLKLEFLLFKEDNFIEPYRELHLWVNST